jgi:hypothetical protein
VIAANGSKSEIEIWPENQPVWLLFCFLQSQWRVGPNGLVGLDYNILYRKLDRMNLSPDEYARWEADIQIMEFAALDQMQENREQAK